MGHRQVSWMLLLTGGPAQSTKPVSRHTHGRTANAARPLLRALSWCRGSKAGAGEQMALPCRVKLGPTACCAVGTETPSHGALAAAAAGTRALSGTYAPPQGSWCPKSGIRAQTGKNIISARAPCGPRRLKLTQTSPAAVTSVW